VSAYIFTAIGLAENILSAALLGMDEEALTVVEAVNSWLKETAEAEADGKPICLDCDATVAGSNPPCAFAVMLPFAATGHAVVSGICGSCLSRCRGDDDLKAMVVRRFGVLWPGLRIVEGGRA
jgi:hypothetical protein